MAGNTNSLAMQTSKKPALESARCITRELSQGLCSGVAVSLQALVSLARGKFAMLSVEYEHTMANVRAHDGLWKTAMLAATVNG